MELVYIGIAAAAVVTWALTHFIVRGRFMSRIKVKEAELAAEKTLGDEREKFFETRLAETKQHADEALAEAKRHSEEQLAEARQHADEALRQQAEALKAAVAAESEKALKAREEELSQRAEKTFSDITENLGRDLKEMKDAFEANKKAQTETSAELKTHLADAVRNLEVQTKDIGSKADHLASAMRGQTKFQGCWGETILGNIFSEEGLVEGRDYTQEQTLRDDLGIVIHTDEGRRMRPDFVLHYPDNTDIIVDSKVSLNALADYIDAKDDESRDAAAKRNLAAVKQQVNNLSGKDYGSYLAPGRKSLDYVVMFIPNYACLQLAKQLEPNIWRDSFRKNVLITTEETIMPFLRMIRSAWINVEQARNQQQIVASAQRMVDRVADFAKAHADMGRKLEDAMSFYEACDKKLRGSGQSIIVAARQVQKYGVPENPQKPLPEPYETTEQIEQQ